MCVCVFVRPLVDISKQSLKGEVEGTKGDLQSTLHQNRDDGVRLHCAFFYKARWMLETFHHGNLENIRIVIETRQGEYQIPESIETVKVLVSVDELPLPVGTYLLSKLIRFFRISPSSDKVLGRKPNPRRPRPTKKVAEAWSFCLYSKDASYKCRGKSDITPPAGLPVLEPFVSFRASLWRLRKHQTQTTGCQKKCKVAMQQDFEQWQTVVLSDTLWVLKDYDC